MRITRFLDEAGQIRHGIDRGDGTAQWLTTSPLEGPPQPTGRITPIHTRLTPIDPTNIFCVGLNYRQHVREMGKQLSDRPVIFMKPTSCATAPGRPIILPACSDDDGEVDHECELAVVIGKAGRDIAEKRALDHVLGYMAANDVSARHWQKEGGGGQWVRGKSFDTFCPLGPVLTLAHDGSDEPVDPQNLTISATINGEVRQHSNTSDMIFPVAKIIAFLSQDTTLLPGTVILTGSPPGVGVSRTPPMFLRAGDEVTIEIEHIGKLTNPVVEAS